MEENTIATVLITAITVLGSASAWRFYEKREERKRTEDNFIREDCRDRIAKLEVLLLKSSEEKDQMRDTILKLVEQVSALTVKVQFLEEENKTLPVMIDDKTQQIGSSASGKELTISLKIIGRDDITQEWLDKNVKNKITGYFIFCIHT